MRQRREQLLGAAKAIVDHYRACPMVQAILCYGSVAMHMEDDWSDIDLFVLCEPAVPTEQERRDVLARVPEVAAIEIGASSAGFDAEWVHTQDTVLIGGLPCDLAYNTIGWLSIVVGHVLTNGHDPLPELPFRPYTLLGLLESSLLLFDREGTLKDVLRSIRPYPSKLRVDLVSLGMTILRESLQDLRDYERRRIGNAAFAFHLNRMSDSLCMVLYALNEQYDPATKRVEQSLAALPLLPADFLRRYEEVLSLPLDPEGRQSVMRQYELLTEDLRGLCEENHLLLSDSGRKA